MITAAPARTGLVVLAYHASQGLDASWALVACDAADGSVRTGTAVFVPEDADGVTASSLLARAVGELLRTVVGDAVVVYCAEPRLLGAMLRELALPTAAAAVTLRALPAPARIQRLLEHAQNTGTKVTVPAERCAQVDVADLRARWVAGGRHAEVLTGPTGSA